MPDLSTIKKPLPQQAKDVLIDIAIQIEVEPDVMPEPDPELVGTEPQEDEPLPELLPEERRNLLQDEPKARLAEKIVAELTDDELKSMPVVKDHQRLRPHRGDWEAAARGEMVEAEREEATFAAIEHENERAPSAEDVKKLNDPPVVEITYGEPRPIYTDGELVGYAPPLPEFVKVQRWLMSEDGRPELVTIEGTP